MAPCTALHPASLAPRLAQMDWREVHAALDAAGFAVLEHLLQPESCAALVALYEQADTFRTTVVMARHHYGKGEYKYFDYPLPTLVSTLRSALYAGLAPLANRWSSELGGEPSFPKTHDAYLRRCHAAGQRRATPLLLRYETGGYNCLHRDIYGELVFPLQVTVLLSRPERDFSGGEFILTEQRARRQSKADVVPLRQGDAVVFAVHQRPGIGSRGVYRVHVRHGVSTLRSGQRHTLGLIFHDAA